MVAQRQRGSQAFSHIEQLAPNMKLIERHFADQDELIATLETENRHLRQRVDDLENQLDRRTEDRDRKEALINWTRDLLSNKTIPMACKLVLWYFHFVFFCMRPEVAGNEMRIGVEAAAEALGISKSTVKRATDKAEKANVLTRRYEDIKLDDGGKLTLAHITLSDTIITPDGIIMEKEQGGKRQKGCRVDGTPLNAYTVRHCPTHGEISVYGQPGNPKGADDDLMINDFLRFYHDRIPSALENDPRKKQDAFANSDDQAHHILPAADHLDTEHLYSKRASSCAVKPKVVICNALISLNKLGKPAHKLEPVVSHQECGCTHWQWSAEDHGPVCAECWTPMPGREQGGK